MIVWVIAGLLGLATGLRIGWALVNKQSLVSTAMILALVHTLIAEGLHDEAFLARYCVGFDRVRAYLMGEGLSPNPIKGRIWLERAVEAASAQSQSGPEAAALLLAREKALAVFDVRPEATRPLAERQARVATSPLDVANQAETVFACLPSVESFHAVASGPDGVLEGKAIKTFVNLGTMGTEAVDVVERAFARGVIDASGIARQAEITFVAVPVLAMTDQVKRALADTDGVVTGATPSASSSTSTSRVPLDRVNDAMAKIVGHVQLALVAGEPSGY